MFNQSRIINESFSKFGEMQVLKCLNLNCIMEVLVNCLKLGLLFSQKRSEKQLECREVPENLE